MATNTTAKTAMATGRYGPHAVWTDAEKQVFEELGIGDGEVALRRLIRGQRRINGKLYDSIDLIIKHLKQTSNSETPELKEAETLNDLVPSADPPKCESGGGGGP
jgi:hypothetical protein